MYQSLSRVSASLVAEYPYFKASFPFNVATCRINEAEHADFVMMLLLVATK